MTHEHPTSQGQAEKHSLHEKQSPTEKLAVINSFSDTYHRFKSGFSPTESNGRAWQELADEINILSDLKENPEDPHNQVLLEGRWPQDKHLDDTRRDALHTYFLAEHGEPTADEQEVALRETRRAILEFQHEEYTESDRRELTDGIFGSIEGKKKVLEFIEDRIAECNAFPDDPQKMELREYLRIARFKLDALYRGQREGEKEIKRAAQREQNEINRTATLTQQRAEIAAIFEAENTTGATVGNEGGSRAPFPRKQVTTLEQNSESQAATQPRSDGESTKNMLDREARERRERIAARRSKDQIPAAEQTSIPTPENPATELGPEATESGEAAASNPEQPEKSETDKVLERQKAALHAALRMMNTVPPDIRKSLFERMNNINPAIINPSQAALDALDPAKLNVPKFNALFHTWSQIIGRQAPSEAFWDGVRRPGHGQFGRMARDTHHTIEGIAAVIAEAQK